MADCQLCGGSHPESVRVCPQARTGQQHDKYILGPLLGVGGIAAVYVAKHPVLGREIAIKILHKRFAKDAELAARFVREARETAALGHPAFVRVYDAGTTADGCAFIEMDRLEGQELYALRKQQGPFPAERVVHLAIGILDALAALHARGVIHRDLKTQNIYVVPSPAGEQVKLLDLGFAKAADNLQLTSKDHILGTPFYISPEQYLDPSAVDARADIFSLGIIMFELLTGEWPYEWQTKRDLLGKVMKGDLERHPGQRRVDVPAWLDAIVAKALAHERDDRFASARAMKSALEAGAPRDKPGLLSRLFG
ncbi:MAG TPA: serine/threonine-protein kinase [Kofleriaceae bacterium]|nr:serine/threonine-protein kinase [Kofleriaceae bacterium]